MIDYLNEICTLGVRQKQNYLLQVCVCVYFVNLVTVPQRNLTELQFLECVAQLVREVGRVLHSPAQHSHRKSAIVLILPSTQL